MPIIIIAIIILLYMFVTYNSFIRKQNKVKQAYSGIDVYWIQRRRIFSSRGTSTKQYRSKFGKGMVN